MRANQERGGRWIRAARRWVLMAAVGAAVLTTGCDDLPPFFQFFLGDLGIERENLIPARVREDRVRPLHEFMQAAHFSDELIAWTQEKVISIGED